VRVDDPLVVALQEARPAAGDDTERDVVADLIGRLRPLRRLVASAVAGTAAGGDTAGAAVREVCDDLAPPGEPDELGRFGSYGILRVLGSGGMGVVFAARQARPRRVVALKMILAGPRADRGRLARFRAEAEIVGRLRHPNIVQVYEAGEHDGRPYFAMEYIDGGSLAQRLTAAPLPPRAAAELTEVLARAVHFAHEQGVVHRDLKPSNVLLAVGQDSNPVSSPAGLESGPTAAGTPKIADFGLAKQFAAEPGTAPGDRTESGALLGTPAYMAPELAAGRGGAAGPAADVYALGAILYECLTGRPPFRAATLLETLDQVRSQEPVPPSRLQPQTPRDLQTVCLKCLDKDPARRYGSARDLADDLGRFRRGEPVRARPASVGLRLVKWTRRQPAQAALLAVSALALGALVAGALVYQSRLRDAVTQAEASAAAARRQQSRADAGYRASRDALDRMLRHLERRRLGEVPQLKELQRDQSEDALAFYQGVLAGADDPDPEVRLDAAQAYERAANIQAFLSRSADAVQSYGRAIDLAEALPPAQRDRPETQDLLAACYGDRGLVGSQPAEREGDVRKSLAIRERLAQAQPDDPGRQNALATSEHQLGQVLINASRWADAEPQVARAAAIRTRLIQEHPQQEGYQEALAGDYVNLGVIYSATGRGEEAIPVYEKLEALLRPLIARHPEDVGGALTLAAAEVNWGLLLRGKGQPQAALARCTEAVELAEAALRREPSHFMARGMTLNAHGARAQTSEALRRWADAAKDWDRVIELTDDGGRRWVRRVLRAMNLAAAGEHARATAEADDLAADARANGEGAWGLAITYARSLRAARSDRGLPSAERDALAERYAARAVALLQKLGKEGYFSQDPAHAQALRTDADLDVLRDRDDFRRLLAEVEGNKGR
jgi:tetratricopeptide (TPR) repeat protein